MLDWHSDILCDCARKTTNLTVSLERQWNVDSNDILSVYGNTVNFSPTSRIHFCVKNTSFCTFKPMGRKCWKISKTAPSSWGTWTPSNTWMPGWPHSPPQTTSGSNQPFCHNTLCGQTYRWSRRMFHNMSAPLAMLTDSDALIITH